MEPTDYQKTYHRVGPRNACSEPWRYGPYRVVITRRVTEEEQISVECYEETLEAAEHTYGRIMSSMRKEMIAYNERVMQVYKDQLLKIERQIENRGEEIRALDAEWEARIERRMDLPNADVNDNKVDGA